MAQKLELTVYGQVQGINLRSMIKVKALDLGISGYVMNQEDNAVKVVAEGEKVKLLALIDWLKTKPGHSVIHRMSDNWTEASGEFDNFEIKY